MAALTSVNHTNGRLYYECRCLLILISLSPATSLLYAQQEAGIIITSATRDMPIELQRTSEQWRNQQTKVADLITLDFKAAQAGV